MKVLISLGPTRHYIDDVRFISNASTGKFGYELAKEALLRRNKVRVVSGPIDMLQIQGVEEWTWITTVDELKEAMEKRFNWADIIIMASAVLDFIPIKKIDGKIPRSFKKLDIKLKSTPDILKSLSKKKGRAKKIIVGLSLQDNNLIESSYSKLKEKNLDLIIAVPLNQPSFPYGNSPVSCVIIDQDSVERLPLWRKYQISEYIWDKI
jgi:phosphopantothenoylcysteine decarboxylase/phosphopantothenate--cysteine ligase